MNLRLLMPKRLLVIILMFCALCNWLGVATSRTHSGAAPTLPVSHSTGSEAGNRAVSYLADEMDRFHKTYDVYTDANAAGNHFAARARISSQGDENSVLPMVEDYADNPYSGLTCIKAEFKAKEKNWGGWYFMNGVLQDKEIAPKENWGTYPNAGIDLRGATRLTFYAKGAKGGERVEFFALGVGWDVIRGIRDNPYADSSPKVSTGMVVLNKSWTLYTIELTGLDLSYVLGGFGWASAAEENNNRDAVFFIDQIQYDKSRLNEPRFILSFQTIPSGNDFDQVMRNVAFVYDNAVAAIAFLAAGETERARLIAAAMVYAQEHDQFYRDGRLRNAYAAGDLALPPGWTPNRVEGAVRLPGYVNTKAEFVQDEFQQSTHVGNLAWAMLALLAYHRADPGDGRYLTAAAKMGDWIIDNCWDNKGPGGFTAGFDGFEGNTRKLTHKATEHSIDMHAVYRQLYELTRSEIYQGAAEHAKRFFTDRRVFDSSDAKFWTGTGADGESVATDVIPVDIQAWALLSLRGENKPYRAALQFAEAHHRVKKGYDFNQDRDGIWWEGTAQVAVAYSHVCESSKSRRITKYITSKQHPSGGVFAANRDGITTGFRLNDNQPWLYFRRLHVGATGWFILADRAVNPFYGALGPNPIVSAASVRENAIRIEGERFCDVSSVLINNAEKASLVTLRGEEFIEMKGTIEQLGLRGGANTIQIIDSQGGASNTFTLVL